MLVLVEVDSDLDYKVPGRSLPGWSTVCSEHTNSTLGPPSVLLCSHVHLFSSPQEAKRP
jgi:hypothetical protein